MEIRLTVIEGPHQGRTFTFEGHETFIVGRSKYAHFRLPVKDKYFSRNHFLAEVNPPRCRLMDLGSTNATFLNGQKVGAIDLNDGDLIAAPPTPVMRDCRSHTSARRSPRPTSTPPARRCTTCSRASPSMTCRAAYSSRSR